MTLNEVKYENAKLEFIAKVRKNLLATVESLTAPDFDENTPAPESYYLITTEENFNHELYNFFIPFVEFLDDCHDAAFFIDKIAPSNFNILCERFLDLTRFTIQIFESTVKIFEEKVIRQHDYMGLLPEFDKEVAKNSLSIEQGCGHE